MPNFGARFDASPCRTRRLHTLIVSTVTRANNAVPKDGMIAGHGLNVSQATCRRPTQAATDGVLDVFVGLDRRPRASWHSAARHAYSEAGVLRRISVSSDRMLFASGSKDLLSPWLWQCDHAFRFSVGAATLLVPGPAKPAPIFRRDRRHFVPPYFCGLYGDTSLTKARNGSCRHRFFVARLALSAAKCFLPTCSRWKTLTGLEIVEGLVSTEALHRPFETGPIKRSSARRGCVFPEL